jgi:hypothetical protein
VPGVLPVLLPLLIVGLLGVLLASPGRDVVARWADHHGLVLTPANRPVVRHYLFTARRLRVYGAFAGLVLPVPLLAAARGHVTGAPGQPLWAVVGYLVGALWAEVALGRPLPSDRPAASLVPRDLAAYLPPGLRLAQRTAGAVAVALAVGALLVDERTIPNVPDADTGGLSDPAAVALGLVAAGTAVALEVVQRWIVGRRQPLVQPDLLAADDAIRSQSVMSLSGAGLALTLLLLSPLFWTLAQSDVPLLRSTAWVPAIACPVLALLAWAKLGHRPWQVRRQPVPTAPLHA